MRDELLNKTLFFTIGQAWDILAHWVDNCNTERPRSSLGYATPGAFAAGLNQQTTGPHPSRCLTRAPERQQSPVPVPRRLKDKGQISRDHSALLTLESLFRRQSQDDSRPVLWHQEPPLNDIPIPFMPEAELTHLKRVYSEAKVILEYGSGGSTELGARLAGKYILSVESDLKWARALRKRLCKPDILSPVVVHHVDVGPVGTWGRPLDDRAWRRFHAYPNEIWDQSWFRHPDVVLIDGRFRTACLATVLLRAERSVRVLFDDYGVRPLYHEVEEVIAPHAMVGRIAEFRVEPGSFSSKHIGLLIQQFFQGSIYGMTEADYQRVSPRHPRSH